jgi:hypothetical protein
LFDAATTLQRAERSARAIQHRMTAPELPIQMTEIGSNKPPDLLKLRKSIRLGAREFDHPGPFLGLIGDELA